MGSCLAEGVGVAVLSGVCTFGGGQGAGGVWGRCEAPPRGCCCGGRCQGLYRGVGPEIFPEPLSPGQLRVRSRSRMLGGPSLHGCSPETWATPEDEGARGTSLPWLGPGCGEHGGDPTSMLEQCGQ